MPKRFSVINLPRDPIAIFMTWVTYGTWLPGDARGWMEYRHGWQLPDPARELEAKSKMTEGACILSLDQRAAVESQIAETCDVRNWILHAVNCRTNHLHIVVTATGIEPAKVRKDLKAWTTRRLRNEFDSARQNWWAERGSIRHIFDEAGLEATILYTIDGQSGPHGPTAPKPP